MLNHEGFSLGLSGARPKRLITNVPPADLTNERARTTRIFQIGYSECGGFALHRFLQRAGISSIYFDRGLLAFDIRENLRAGRQPLAGRISAFSAFGNIHQLTRDGVIEGRDFFKELYGYYPHSYFILNTGDKEKCISARVQSKDGGYAKRYARALKLEGVDEVAAHWAKDWERHHQEVAAFFAGKPGRLCTFDPRRDSPQKLVDFLASDFRTRASDFHQDEVEG